MKKEVIVQVQAKNIAWAGYQDPKTGTWIGVCQALNLNAVGDTFAELQACANEAMDLLFTDLLEDGELDAFLRRNGWSLKAAPSPGAHPRFDVPANWNSRARLNQLVPAGK
jgi:predicted RNase H-like HicB family nuclease